MNMRVKSNTKNNNTNQNSHFSPEQPEQALLSDDECLCKYCQAMLFIPFFGKYIPVSQFEFDHVMFHGYKSMFPLDKLIPNSRYIAFVKDK